MTGLEHNKVIVLRKRDQVKNADFTSHDHPPGGHTWHQLWEKHTKKYFPDECAKVDCEEEATDGAHVYVKRFNSNQEYYFIIPLCHDCNINEEGWFNTDEDTRALVRHKNECVMELEQMRQRVNMGRGLEQNKVIIVRTRDKVKNVEGSTCDRVSSWRKTWEKKTKEPFPEECANLDCHYEATDGAHVYIKRFYNYGNPTHYFIIPLCRECNLHEQDWFYTDEGTKALVRRKNPCVP